MKKLNRDEPFTSSEKAGLSKKEQFLIRGIQLRDKVSKDEAKEIYVDYLHKGKRAVKQLSSSVRKHNKKYYPKIGGQVSHEVDEYRKPESKLKIKKKNKKKVKLFLSEKKNYYKNKKTYVRIENASKKYPNASLGELRHGVNSKWSQDYRVSHGLNRNYK